MVALALGSAASAANPVLDAYVLRIDAGPPQTATLAEPASLAFQVFDVSTETKQSTPVQVYPAQAGQRHAVDLVADRVGPGRYAAAWSVPGNAALGRYEVRWFCTMDEGGPEVRWRREFDVLTGVAGFGAAGYCLLADLREEGLTAASVSDARLQRLIAEASRQIERWTRRWFEPRALSLRLDGTKSRALRFDAPIIVLDGVQYEEDADLVDASNFRVYNRHITEGLLSPDDRDNPRVEWQSERRPWIAPIGTAWPVVTPVFHEGRQNIVASGLFGYTDPDGSFVGGTPEGIRRATMLMVLREASKLTAANARFDARERHRLINERTRDQSYQLSPGRAALAGQAGTGVGGWTGDPAIDDLVDQFVAPPRILST